MITGQDFNELKESVHSMNVLMMTNKIELENEIKELKNKLKESNNKLAENEKVLELHRQTISSILDTLEKITAK